MSTPITHATCKCGKQLPLIPGVRVICEDCGMAYRHKVRGRKKREHDAVDLKRALDMEPAKLKRALDGAGG